MGGRNGEGSVLEVELGARRDQDSAGKSKHDLLMSRRRAAEPADAVASLEAPASAVVEETSREV